MKVGVLVRLSPQEREEWKAAAAHQGLSVTEMVRRFVASALTERGTR